MGKKTRAKVIKRMAAQRKSKAAIRAAWLHEKVYGRKNEEPPPESPSTSVRTVGGGFETNRRKH